MIGDFFPEKNQGFEIKCLNCGSTDCEIQENGDYNDDDDWESYGGIKIVCHRCGQDV